MRILTSLDEKKKKGIKSLAVLIDPDKIQDEASLIVLIDLCNSAVVDYIFVGGSLLVKGSLSETVALVKKSTKIPLILFPGSNLHIDKSADAILFLSLISGRNPELLIGQHVAAAPILRNSHIEVLSTGYILVGDNMKTTVAHLSQTSPIPSKKSDIAVCTAMAGELLGMKLIYLDAGSGAEQEVPAEMIDKVNKSIKIPLIAGGGINSISKARTAYKAGADMIVLGTAVEKNSQFITEVAELRNQLNPIHS